MLSLHELQSRIMGCLLDGAIEDTSGLIEEHGMAVADRLGIYRGNIVENYGASLRSSFPVLVQLVGDDYFRDATRQLQQSQPSLSGDLANVGETFSAFLEERHQTDQYRYLAHVARFEWLCQKSLLAAHHAPLDLARLASVSDDDYDKLGFSLHPSVNLFESPYPCLQIWQSHSAEHGDDVSIDLDSGGVRVAIAMQARQLTFHPLGASEHAFLQALLSGHPLGTAIDIAISADPAFDATNMLQRCVTTQLIVDPKT